MRALTVLVLTSSLALLPQAAMAADWLLDGHDTQPRMLPADASLDGKLSRFSVSFWSGSDRYTGFHDPELARSGFGAELRHRLGDDGDALWWGLDTRLGIQDPVEAFDTNGWQLGVTVGRGWRSGFDLRGRIDYERAPALLETPNPAQSWRASAELDYAWSEQWSLFAGLGYRRGLGNGNGAWGNEQQAAFGPGWRSYQTSARTVTFTFGAHIDLGPATQFLVAWQRLDARDRDIGLGFDSNIYRFQIQHGF